MLGIACAVAVVTLIVETQALPRGAHRAWRCRSGRVAGRVRLSGHRHPAMDPRVRSARMEGAQQRRLHGELSPDDLAAMHWLYDNAEDDDVIIEAPGCSYQVNGGIPTSGLAAMTGVPTIIGWGCHESPVARRPTGAAGPDRHAAGRCGRHLRRSRQPADRSVRRDPAVRRKLRAPWHPTRAASPVRTHPSPVPTFPARLGASLHQRRDGDLSAGKDDGVSPSSSWQSQHVDMRRIGQSCRRFAPTRRTLPTGP